MQHMFDKENPTTATYFVFWVLYNKYIFCLMDTYWLFIDWAR
jgi:hypothetical protein